MPARPPVANVIQVNTQYLVGTKIAENVLHFSFTPAGPSNLAFVGAVAAAATTWGAANNALWGADTAYTGTVVTDLTSDVAPTTEALETTAGVRAGDPIGANTAVLASYTIGRRYRGGHPRTYLPWFTADDVETPQTWKSASQTEAQDGFSTLITEIEAASGGGFSILEQVNVSYIYSIPVPGTPRPVPLVDVINFSTIDLNLASQRRRDGRH
jgi:hypothetical protein